MRWAAALGLCAAMTGCGDGGTGAVEVTTWGEQYIEDAIPASELADGWTVTFDAFLIVLADVTIADREGTIAASMDGSKLFDHKTKGVKPVVRFEGLEAKAWDRVSFRTRPADGATELEGATEADKELLLSEGAAVHVEGRATKGDVTKTFRWSFGQTTLYAECRGDKDGKEIEGVLVTNGGTDSVELTIHGDHLFYDDLQAEQAVLRFDAMAAADDAGDADGDVTLAELSAVPLVDIAEGSYGTGSASTVNDLGAFVTALASTLGHFRGEGECISR
jgi:hypothetical protein